MKDFKIGFSLAELLICLAIIAVIATFGFAITKHNIDSAYDRYIYTGYRGLYDAILEANAQGYEFTESSGYIFNNFKGYIGYLLNKTGEQTPKDSYEINASNGVKYKFVDFYGGESSGEPCYVEIEMQVPSKKRIGSNNKTINHHTICLGYWPQEDYGVLLPLNNTQSCSNTIDVRDRIDLLPFYLEDGVVGRFVDTGDGQGKIYRERTYYSAKNAICTVFGTITIRNRDNSVHYTCTNSNTNIIIFWNVSHISKVTRIDHKYSSSHSFK